MKTYDICFRVKWLNDDKEYEIVENMMRITARSYEEARAKIRSTVMSDRRNKEITFNASYNVVAFV